MASDLIPYSLSRHPAPHRQSVGVWTILYGVFVSGIVWAGHLMLSYALAAHACYPGTIPLARPDSGAGWAWPLILGLDLLALCLIASGFWISWRMWMLTGQDAHGHAHHLMEVGEGRTRFLGIVGMAFAMLFFFITASDTISLAMVPICAR
jgi:hypothetical protein